MAGCWINTEFVERDPDQFRIRCLKCGSVEVEVGAHIELGDGKVLLELTCEDCDNVQVLFAGFVKEGGLM